MVVRDSMMQIAGEVLIGGSIYRGSGSHGCVNCPYSTAATLYKYVDAGFPVIVY